MAFYGLMKKLGSESVPNSADFRLMSSRALNGLAEYEEVNLFLRGMVPLVGYKSPNVYYNVENVLQGKQVSLKKMVSFAIDGITSTSATPMRFIFWTGLTSSCLLCSWNLCCGASFHRRLPNDGLGLNHGCLLWARGIHSWPLGLLVSILVKSSLKLKHAHVLYPRLITQKVMRTNVRILKGKLVKITQHISLLMSPILVTSSMYANPYSWSHRMNQEIEIYVHQVIREDAHSLYGFMDDAEKSLFLRLISVSGIGPKSALAIIAADDNVGLVHAIRQ